MMVGSETLLAQATYNRQNCLVTVHFIKRLLLTKPGIFMVYLI